MCLESNLRIDESREKLEEPLLIYLAKTNGFLYIFLLNQPNDEPGRVSVATDVASHFMCFPINNFTLVSQKTSNLPGWQGGSTAVLMATDGQQLCCCSVGDSRAVARVAAAPSGTLRLTREHSCRVPEEAGKFCCVSVKAGLGNH